MFYEAKLIDGRLWHRSHPRSEFTKASAEETIKYLLELLREKENVTDLTA